MEQPGCKTSLSLPDVTQVGDGSIKQKVTYEGKIQVVLPNVDVKESSYTAHDIQGAHCSKLHDF